MKSVNKKLQPRPVPPKKINPVYIVFFLAFALRLLYLWQVRHSPVLDFLCIDAEYYHDWAAAIARGDILGGPHVFTMAPFYAYFLALIYFYLGIHFLPALLIQILIGSFSCVLIYRIAQKYFDLETARYAGIISAVYPVFIFYDATLLKENLMVFFILLFILFYVKRSPWSLFLAGVCMGINALMRPTIFLALPFLAGYDFFRNKDIWLRRALLVAAGIAVTVFPVALRNRVVAGEWVITVASGGMNFWTGNNDKATGAYVGAPFITSEEPEFEREDFRREASKRTGKELTVKEASDFWYREGMDFITREPSRFLHLLWRKFYAFWHTTELPSDLNFYFARDFSGVLKYNFLAFGAIVPLAVIGFFLARKTIPLNYLLVALAGSNLLASLIFFNSSRYRLPIVPIFILYAGFAVSSMVRHYKAGNGRALKILAATVPFFILVNIPDPVLSRIAGTRVSYLNAATYYMRSQQYSEAEAMLKKSLEIDPDYALAYQKLAALRAMAGKKEESKELMARSVRYAEATGDERAFRSMEGSSQAVVLYQQRRYDQALTLFKQSLSAHPEDAKELNNNIGLCYLKLGDYRAAEKVFIQNLNANPDYDKGCYNLGLLYKLTNEPEKAARYFRKTLKINPAHGKARQHLQAAAD